MKISPNLAVPYSESWLTPIPRIKPILVPGKISFGKIGAIGTVLVTQLSGKSPTPTKSKNPESGKHMMHRVGVFLCTPYFVKIKTTAVPFVINKKTL